MRLTSLHLEYFRSYERAALRFGDESRQLFIGDNGAGKTNLVEAASFLSMGRSCLRVPSDNVAAWGQDFFRIKADLNTDSNESTSVEYVWQRVPRRSSAMFVRDVRTPLLEFIGVLPTITFLPQDLDLFTGSPSARRNFLDALLSQLKPEFAALRLEYDHVLKQRNAVIARVADGEAGTEELELWDSRLVPVAARLTVLRCEAVSLINREIARTLAELGETAWTDALIVFERKTTGDSVESLEPELLSLLRACRQRDLILRGTTVGPHRDDWHLKAQDRDIALFGSRGQQRAAFIALLLQSAALFGEVRAEKPVIFLDDVLSELDDAHQSALMDSLHDHQVFITAAHPIVTDSAQIWSVKNGTVMPLSHAGKH